MSAPGRGLIDFRALERELQGAVQSEEKYERENAVKLRAVSQGVPSYEQFRSLVLTSHLQPVKRQDKQSRKQPWNPVAAGNGTRHMNSGGQRGDEDSPSHQDWTGTNMGQKQD